MRLLPGRPVSHSWLWPPAVLRALPWDGMTRQTPAGTTTPLRSAGRCRPPRPEWRTPALPEMSPRAAQQAAGEREPRTGQGDVTAAAGRPPQAAGEQSRDEPWVSGEDDEGLPAPRLAAAGATADPVKDYLAQIGKVPLLTAGQEVELAKRIEAGLFAEDKLAGGSGVLRRRPARRP